MGGVNFGDCVRIGDIVDSFISWGQFIKIDQLHAFNRYLKEMLRRNRVIIIENEGRIEAVICYFLTDDVSKFDNKPFWSTPYDSEDGDIIFIDKMVARKWTRELRSAIYDAVIEKYPFVEQAQWLREPLNRHVIINRRRHHELHSQVS